MKKYTEAEKDARRKYIGVPCTLSGKPAIIQKICVHKEYTRYLVFEQHRPDNRETLRKAVVKSENKGSWRELSSFGFMAIQLRVADDAEVVFEINQVVLKGLGGFVGVQVLNIREALVGYDMIIKPDDVALNNCSIKS